MNNDLVFNRIAEALLCDYSSVYYVDGITNEYITYSLDPKFKSLKIEMEGNNFFQNLIPDSEKVVHPDDWHIFKRDIQKENLLSGMKNGTMQSIIYRLMIGGVPVYHELRLIRGMSKSDEYFILGVKNIDKEIRMQQEAERLESERKVYNQIAQSLASRYDTIYYVDSQSNTYTEFSASDAYAELNIPKTGGDFFKESFKNFKKYIHKDDMDMMFTSLEKENLINRLKKERHFALEYRLHINGEYRYTRLSAMWANDRIHIIMGVEDINEEHLREIELRNANQKALTDELTGVKNMNAYQESEMVMQSRMDSGNCQPFALLICDLNNLKKINDTEGHKSGDEYLKEACRLICSIFAHSPVFRIGGDEFVVILNKNDYTDRFQLMSELQSEVRKNLDKTNAPVIAAGLAEYDPDTHTKVCEIFELADSRMYQNKKELKAQR